MNDLIEKISSYNLFNCLFPGVVFCVMADLYTSFSFVTENILMAFFGFYFVGLTISRFGSLVVEPLLTKSNFVEFVDYKSYIEISRNDPKLDALSEMNNVYRTLASLFISLLLVKLVDILLIWLKAPPMVAPTILIFILGTIFLISYRNQTSYIRNRVNNQLE